MSAWDTQSSWKEHQQRALATAADGIHLSVVKEFGDNSVFLELEYRVRHT